MATPTGPSFHPFPRLPLELRQQIWGLSVAPREVVIVGRPRQHWGHGRQASPPPPVLLASSESRSYCQQFYTKASVRRELVGSDKYSWINFDLDDVYITDEEFMSFSAISLVQRLTIVVGFDGEFFHRRVEGVLWGAVKSLKSLTIIDREPTPAEHWYSGWADFMQSRYYRCDPVPYYTTVVYEYQGFVLTPDTMLKFDREQYKTDVLPELEENPDDFEPISDDDADPRDSYRRRWQHTKDCTCPQKNRPRYRYM